MATLLRSELEVKDTWDLSSIFESTAAWENALSSLPMRIKELTRYKGQLTTQPEKLKAYLEHYFSVRLALDHIEEYAQRLADQDTSDSTAQGRSQQALALAADLASETAFFQPELLSIPDATLSTWLQSAELSPYARYLRELLRYKAHTLSHAEEELLARGTEVFVGASEIFSQLNNADFNFGTLHIDGEDKPLTHASLAIFLKHQDRQIRRKAFEQHYSVYEAHQNALATVLTTSVRTDVYFAKVRKYPSALEMHLFTDRVEKRVYDTLIDTIAAHSKSVARYYKLKAKFLGLPKLSVYDTLVSPVKSVNFHHTFDQASRLIVESLKPLGAEYCSVLESGLTQKRWVDRYENKGKRSGAYSAGRYGTAPYILMNYQDDLIQDVFTLAHEAGHSMHSYLSRHNQAYPDHEYPILTAEVASTFNEQLLFAHLISQQTDASKQAYLINQHLEEINGTLFRQVMYADFERQTHAAIENGEPLTVTRYRQIWRSVLERFYGDSLHIDPLAELGCFRIPHFYWAFYVYKYATGLAAAMTLADRVLSGEANARSNYLNFLKSGGSKPPLETLQAAGVDLRNPEPIERVMQLFDSLCDQLEAQLLQLNVK
jgi:oligoendopeptidase F